MKMFDTMPTPDLAPRTHEMLDSYRATHGALKAEMLSLYIRSAFVGMGVIKILGDNCDNPIWADVAERMLRLLSAEVALAACKAGVTEADLVMAATIMTLDVRS